MHTIAQCIIHTAKLWRSLQRRTGPWCTLYSSPCRTMMYNHVRSAELDLTSGFERSSCRLVLPSAAANWPEVEQSSSSNISSSSSSSSMDRAQVRRWFSIKEAAPGASPACIRTCLKQAQSLPTDRSGIFSSWSNKLLCCIWWTRLRGKTSVRIPKESGRPYQAG